MLRLRTALTIGVMALSWSSASAQAVNVSPGLWDRPEWRKASFASPLGVEATYRRVFDKLRSCFAGYGFRILGNMARDASGASSKAEILVVKNYRQLVYGLGDIYFAFQIRSQTLTHSNVDSYQSTRFSEVFVAAVPRWLDERGAPCRIR